MKLTLYFLHTRYLRLSAETAQFSHSCISNLHDSNGTVHAILDLETNRGNGDNSARVCNSNQPNVRKLQQ